MSEKYYQDKLYPLQDHVLSLLEMERLDFFLTGGTALSRCYLGHRYSDDLDFFVNDHDEFKQQCQSALSILQKKYSEVSQGVTSDAFMRIFVTQGDIALKIDFVNDVTYRYGELTKCQIFSRVDHWRNVLSNKVCALGRDEAKDIVDIVFLAMKYPFEWEEIIEESLKKDSWVSPVEVTRMIERFPLERLKSIQWIDPVDPTALGKNIVILCEDIFYGRSNSLVGMQL